MSRTRRGMRSAGSGRSISRCARADCAARLGGRRELRFLTGWIDAWLLATSTPVIVNPLALGDDGDRNRVDSPTH